MLRVYGAGDGVAELDLVVANGMAADHGAAGLHHLGESAGQDALKDGEVAGARETDHGERAQGTAAHGVDVAEGVGGGDLAEGVGIVDDGREEIDGLHQRQVGGDQIHSGVVGGVEADQDLGVMLPG